MTTTIDPTPTPCASEIEHEAGFCYNPCGCGDRRFRCDIDMNEVQAGDVVAIHLYGEGCKVYRVDVVGSVSDCTPAEQITPGRQDWDDDGDNVSPAFTFARESVPVPLCNALAIVLRRSSDWQD